jgi:hypothetical protein
MDQLEDDPAIFVAAVQGAVAMARALVQEAKAMEPDIKEGVADGCMIWGDIVKAEGLAASGLCGFRHPCPAIKAGQSGGWRRSMGRRRGLSAKFPRVFPDQFVTKPYYRIRCSMALAPGASSGRQDCVHRSVCSPEQAFTAALADPGFLRRPSVSRCRFGHWSVAPIGTWPGTWRQ